MIMSTQKFTLSRSYDDCDSAALEKIAVAKRIKRSKTCAFLLKGASHTPFQPPSRERMYPNALLFVMIDSRFVCCVASYLHSWITNVTGCMNIELHRSTRTRSGNLDREEKGSRLSHYF